MLASAGSLVELLSKQVTEFNKKFASFIAVNILDQHYTANVTAD